MTALRLLRAVPAARALFLLYLLLLHAWLCVVIALRTQSFEEVHADAGAATADLPDMN